MRAMTVSCRCPGVFAPAWLRLRVTLLSLHFSGGSKRFGLSVTHINFPPIGLFGIMRGPETGR